jgi:hypothetical protein
VPPEPPVPPKPPLDPLAVLPVLDEPAEPELDAAVFAPVVFDFLSRAFFFDFDAADAAPGSKPAIATSRAAMPIRRTVRLVRTVGSLARR